MSRFRIYPVDETFDYAKGPLPNSLVHSFGDTLKRARALLDAQALHQVKEGFCELDRLLQQGGKILEEQIAQSTDDEMFVDRVKALVLLKESEVVDFTTHHTLLRSWTECFALFALAIIGEPLYLLRVNDIEEFQDLLGSEFEHFERVQRVALLHELSLEASEAVHQAESLENASIFLKEAMQRRGKAGGKKNYSDFDELKEKILAIDAEKCIRMPSKNAAAIRIYKELNETDRAVFRTSDEKSRVASIAKWLPDRKKT